MMRGRGKSDPAVGAAKQVNKAGRPAAERRRGPRGTRARNARSARRDGTARHRAWTAYGPAVSHPRREPNAGCERKAHCGNAARWDLWGRKPAMAELPDKAARTVLCGGRTEMPVPTATGERNWGFEFGFPSGGFGFPSPRSRSRGIHGLRSRHLHPQFQKSPGRRAHRGQLQARRRRKRRRRGRREVGRLDRARPGREAPVAVRPRRDFACARRCDLRTTSRLASGASIATLVPSQPGKAPPPLAR